MGHGSILLMEGLYMVLNADKLKQSKAGKAIAKYRYLFTLMGMMATYCGFIYNEFFALKLNLFGSCYDLNNIKEQVKGQNPEDSRSKWFWPRKWPKCTYPMGMDPVWGQSEFELTFSNSIKMKLSVIFGVLHMSIGIIMKGTNMVYRRHWLELVTEVFAGFFMLFFLFGWMDILILTKWFQTPNVFDCDYRITYINNERGGVEEQICNGQYANWQVQFIINVMVTTVFGFGQYAKTNPDQVPIHGKTLEAQYATN